MSSDRVLSLRNRAVRVALSLLPVPDQPTQSQIMVPPPDVTVPNPADAVDARLAQMERLLQDLSLRVRDQSAVVPADPYAIFIRNRRYDTVLAVETYSLQDRTQVFRQDQMTTLSTTASLIRPRLEGSFFSGSPSLGVLPFLSQVVRVANQTQMSEAILLWILEDFLRPPCKEAFRMQAHKSWPEAVHWLLTSYAPETALEQAVRRLQTSSQLPGENVRDFGLRIQSEASLLGALIPLPELKALFSQGLRDPISSLFVAGKPVAELGDAAPLSVLLCRAELIERGHPSAVSVPSKFRRNPSPRVALTLPLDNS